MGVIFGAIIVAISLNALDASATADTPSSAVTPKSDVLSPTAMKGAE
jgi:hypothetical protein